jgi:hypothetical protein
MAVRIGLGEMTPKRVIRVFIPAYSGRLRQLRHGATVAP